MNQQTALNFLCRNILYMNILCMNIHICSMYSTRKMEEDPRAFETEQMSFITFVCCSNASSFADMVVATLGASLGAIFRTSLYRRYTRRTERDANISIVRDIDP